MYIINLNHRVERLKLTRGLLKKAGFTDVNRYRAINGKNLSQSYLNKLVVPDAMIPVKRGYRTEHHELSYGAIGCYLSHLNIWKTAKNDVIIVFEDDALPKFDIKTLKDYLNYVPEDWDIILFGAILSNRNRINEYVEKTTKFMCTHAYMINKKAITKILDKALPITKQLDFWLSDMASAGEINVYSFTKNKWIQNEQVNSTDIQIPIKTIA